MSSGLIITINYYYDFFLTVSQGHIISELQARVNIFETKFQRLTSQTLKRLQQNGVSVGTFYAQLQVTCMKHTLKRLAGISYYVKECYKQLGASVSPLESLWGELNDFWDFFQL